jgi:ribonuclease HI
MISQSNSPQTQAAKEEARRLALQLGFALERRQGMIETVDLNGNRTILCRSSGKTDIWEEALTILQKRIGVKKSSSPIKEQIYSDVVIYTDGGSRGNPGPSASGFVIYDNQGKILEEGGEYLGITTNNQAEYQALKLALERASDFTKGIVDVHMDSLLVVNQMKGIYKVKNRDLWPVYASIKILTANFSKVKFTHVFRASNSAADSLVNKILDARI